jgi:hypothetical protein
LIDADLQAGEMRVVGRLVDASNATLLCEIGSEESPLSVIYKPIAGERSLWDFPDGELAKREVAAFIFSELLGYGIVPETIFRDGPFGLGSVQRWIDVDEEIDVVALAQSMDPQIRAMAIFDVLINNTDRKFGHILPTASGKIYGCDHGVAFHHEDKLRTVLWQFAGEPLSESEQRELSLLPAKIEGSELPEFLSDEDLLALLRRIDRTLTANSFPFPSEDWPAVPWPPF